MIWGITSMRLRISPWSSTLRWSRAAISSAMAVTSFLVASASSRLPWPMSMPIRLLITFRWLRR